MTSLVPGLGQQNCIFCQLWRDRKIILRAGTELKFENYESVQHRLQFSGIIKGAKISFHRHFNEKKQAFHKFSSFHFASEVLVLDLEPNYVPPTHHTHNQPNTCSVLLQLCNLLHHVITSLSPQYFNFISPVHSSFLRRHYSFVLRLRRPGFFAHTSPGKWLFVMN